MIPPQNRPTTRTAIAISSATWTTPDFQATLYDEIFDEYRLCDDIGLHIVTNEHHSGINNLWAASPVITGVVARITRNVRILTLGTLITVRKDPVRAAESTWNVAIPEGQPFAVT